MRSFIICVTRVITSRKIRWAGRMPRMGELRNAYYTLVGKAEGKRPLGTPRRRWKYIRMDVREIGWEGADWIHLAQDRDQWGLLRTW
jgi:hypothetical protein